MGDALPHTDSRISTAEDDGVHDYDGSDDDNDEGIKMQLTQLYAFIVQVRGLLPEDTCPGTLRRMCSALTAFLQSTDTNVSEKIWHLLEAQRACGELRQYDSGTLEEGMAKIIPAMDDLLQTLIQQIREMLNSRFNEVREARQEEIQEATVRHNALNTRLDEVLLSLGQAATHAKDREDALNARLDEAAAHAKDREDALNARLDEAAAHAKDREDALNARLDEAQEDRQTKHDELLARIEQQKHASRMARRYRALRNQEDDIRDLKAWMIGGGLCSFGIAAIPAIPFLNKQIQARDRIKALIQKAEAEAEAKGLVS